MRCEDASLELFVYELDWSCNCFVDSLYNWANISTDNCCYFSFCFVTWPTVSLNESRFAIRDHKQVTWHGKDKPLEVGVDHQRIDRLANVVPPGAFGATEPLDHGWPGTSLITDCTMHKWLPQKTNANICQMIGHKKRKIIKETVSRT